MILGGQNYRGAMLDQNRRVLGDATNAVQFLQSSRDGSRQGNLFLSTVPGASSYDGYNTSGTLNNPAVFGSGPLTRFSVAGP